MKNKLFAQLFHFDSLAITMMVFLSLIGLCICRYAYRYMSGDARYKFFFAQITLLIISVMLMVSANHFVLFICSWCASNALLVRLMRHKISWKAAKASGLLALKYYLFGALALMTAFIIFYSVTGQTTIQGLIDNQSDSVFISFALLFLLIGAMLQSSIWPFHPWLISSLNSPTPVSAVMHAGLVNGGGFLLVRFAPLYLKYSSLLLVIFVVGLITALLGTLWKLMQNDVKRMLACSTMGQMGFMFVQCGLGLFPAAIAHLVWHSMFKAYLFLASGSAAQEKRYDLGYPPELITFICALLCGAVGSIGFAYVTGKSWFAGDTTLVLMVLAFLSASQFALSILKFKSLFSIATAFIITAAFGLLYGMSVQLVAWAIEPMHLMQPQLLNGFHMIGIAVLTLAWLSILFLRNRSEAEVNSSLMPRTYVFALNASQPHPTTVTAIRNQYQYQ
ncbi:oxidoreductase [Candidatus Berkiella cookevillensis]|uniref:Oxidoreductase n=1 Tax=Candidatus Berkiella cookevillensis TaxID=437022 RepID=A0A0Q9YGG4_9GAMM|nr:proton-conducting transporter membrane subunit [Candidatus Berkiella cookevillensis]MCS5707656.1 oxidoreductase [Candidatus Berkiella cookevillensis]